MLARQALGTLPHQWSKSGFARISTIGLCNAISHMTHPWFKPRGYKHLDVPVGEPFVAKASKPDFVKGHHWLPLIHYVKRQKRYKPKDGKTVYKDRDIMYASHRDACILSKYAHELSSELDIFYERNGLCDHVIAYRKLGKSNYIFSAEAYRFAVLSSPCIVLCFDITGFFDNLNHAILKDRLKRVLSVKELPEHWYRVFRHVTCFKTIELEDLKAHPVFGPKLKLESKTPIATISEIKAAGIRIQENANEFGIPQGTPISSALSNLYMIDIDLHMSGICRDRNALYQRYSDDILIVCQPNDENNIVSELLAQVGAHKLKIKKEKTERVRFIRANPNAFQYLGFDISPEGVTIRPSSLSRQWRKLKRGIKKAKYVSSQAIRSGEAKVELCRRMGDG